MGDFAALRKRAMRLLERWAMAAEEYWHGVPDDPALGCYGPGYLTWGVQSNWNYAAAMATLAAQPAATCRERWQQRALASLRFALATHVTGSRPSNDGRPWGNSWISMLGVERALHGVKCLDGELSRGDREALRRMLTGEADWLLLHPARGRRTGVSAGLWASGGCNNPESNIWSGALLWRVAGQYPEEANAAAWRRQAHRFLLNGVSVEADAGDGALVAGLPVAEWHAGANFFPHYALDHHGYLNVGYMAICVSNAAILHFDLKRAGMTPPESLYHHQADLWRVLRGFIFGDGRLARIGGDSRVRYAYCQEYLLPSLLFAADRLQDNHALALAERQLTLMEREAAGGDGLFYGGRLGHLRAANPHYYTRLESDRACVLAMLLNYLPLVDPPRPPAAAFEDSVAGGWMEEAHAAVMHRSGTRLCSFAWRAHGLSQGLCVSPEDGSMAEWEMNLCPVVRCLGDDGSRPGAHRRLLAHHLESFAGGFVTSGAVMEGVDVAIDEAACCTDQAVTQIAFAALPDGRTCLVLQYVVAAADRVVYISGLKDLHLVVPNDLFNGNQRLLRTAGSHTKLRSPPANNEILEFESNWANIDDRLGIVVLNGANSIMVDRSTARRGGRYSSIFTEEFCLHLRKGISRCRPGEVLVDIGVALLAGASAETTAGLRGGAMPMPHHAVKCIWVETCEGRRYAMFTNFDTRKHIVNIFEMSLSLPPGQAILREIVGGEPGRQ